MILNLYLCLPDTLRTNLCVVFVQVNYNERNFNVTGDKIVSLLPND